MLVLLFNPLDDFLDLNRRALEHAEILVLLECVAHTIECLSDFTTLVGHQALSKEAFEISLTAVLLAEPVENNSEMFLSLIVQQHGDLHSEVLIGLDHEVVLDNVVLPNLHDFLEESLGIVLMAHL